MRFRKTPTRSTRTQSGGWGFWRARAPNIPTSNLRERMGRMPKTGLVSATTSLADLAKPGRLVIPRLVMHKPPPLPSSTPKAGWGNTEGMAKNTTYNKNVCKGPANRLSQTAALKHAKHRATLKRRTAGTAGGLALSGGLAGLLGGLLGKKRKQKGSGGKAKELLDYFDNSKSLFGGSIKQRGGIIDYFWNPSPPHRSRLLDGWTS